MIILPDHNDEAYNTISSIEQLCEFAEGKLANGYDGDGWENLERATATVRKVIKEFYDAAEKAKSAKLTRYQEHVRRELVYGGKVQRDRDGKTCYLYSAKGEYIKNVRFTTIQPMLDSGLLKEHPSRVILLDKAVHMAMFGHYPDRAK